MRPLGIYVIGISIYILNMIHFMMISGDFGVFSLMLTDGHTDPRTDPRTDGRTDIRTDRPSYRDARTHLKTGHQMRSEDLPAYFFLNANGRTDTRMDTRTNTRTDGQTLI